MVEGLTAKALKEEGYSENKRRYNGIEFNKDFELNTYDAFYRTLDPQLGRWWNIDPEIESMEAWSPYASNFNIPITFSDPLGDEPEEVDGNPLGGCCGINVAQYGDFAVKGGEAFSELIRKGLIIAGETLNGLLGIEQNPSATMTGSNTYTSEDEASAGSAYRTGELATPFTPIPTMKLPGKLNLSFANAGKVALNSSKPVPLISNKVNVKSNSSSTGGNSSNKPKNAKEPLAHSKLIRKIVLNSSKPGVKLSDKKIEQLKKVVKKSGGNVRTEVGTIKKVKGIKHSQVEGYGTSTSSRHIIHEKQ